MRSRSPALWALAWICLLTSAGSAKPVFLKLDVTYVDFASGQPLQSSTLGQVPVRAEFPGQRATGNFTRGDVIGNTGEIIQFDPQQAGDLNFRFEKDQFMPVRKKILRPKLESSTRQAPCVINVSLATADRQLLFRTEPAGATVWLVQSGNAGSTSNLGRGGVAESHYLDKLGLVDTTWEAEGQAPPVRSFTVAVGSSDKQGSEILPHPGYELLNNAPLEGQWLNTFGANSTTVMLPPEGSEPLKLKPAAGLAALAQRQLQEHLTRSISMGVVLVVMLILVPTVLLPRLKAGRAVEASRKKRDDMLKNVDITRDPLLGQPFATSHSEWTIVKKLGAGGMAVVYWALPSDTFNEDDAVALKVMNDEVAEDVEYRKRFDREIQISNQLNHPNIVRLIDWGQREDRLFLVMEFIRGSTLRDHIPKSGASISDTVNILRGLSAGLSHAHKLGVVHRDLKPDNIMINHNQQVKIMDLGLAKRDENRTAITKTGDTFGTPAYMAPEQIAGSGVPDPRTDQYAVGVMVYELLTGRRPFEEEDSLQMIMKHLQEVPPSIREFKPELPEAAAQVVAKMLAKDPSARYANVQAACGALEDALRPLLAH